MDSGILDGLKDLSFTKFVTIKVIKIIYIIAVILSAIWGVTTLIGGIGLLMAGNMGTGLLTIILSPVAFILGVLGARLYLEIIVIFFRIEANTRKV